MPNLGGGLKWVSSQNQQPGASGAASVETMRTHAAGLVPFSSAMMWMPNDLHSFQNSTLMGVGGLWVGGERIFEMWSRMKRDWILG